MPTLSTYIAFPGNAAEAFAHYQEVLGGELSLMRYGDFPPMEGMPFEPDPATVAHAQLDTLVAAGGSVNMPFELAPWGSYYGQVFDKFGVMWPIDVAAAKDAG